ncbi:MAG: hypothetical protein RTU30_09505 [Candidatus Thorarchaeota archaeon]
MVRLTTISNIFAGIGFAVLGFSVGIKYLLESLGQTGTAYPFYVWIGGAVLLALVIIFTIINTFTEMTGFVHPEDKLVSNMFVFLMTIAAILVFGYLDEGETFQFQLFNMSTMIVVAFVFLFIFVFFSKTILEGGETGQLKEMTARFMMVSLVLGAIMAGLQFLLGEIYLALTYAGGAIVLGIVAVILVISIALFLIRQYEPVGGDME